jgi:AAA+ ATPase superfamily predicted ATPase
MNPFIFGKVVLYGRRRVGKSSLVLNTAKQHPKRLFLLIDLFFTKDTAMFLEYSTNVLFAFNSQRKRYILTIPSCAFSFKGSYHKKSTL